MAATKLAAVYLRVSTDRQTVQNQLAALERLLADARAEPLAPNLLAQEFKAGRPNQRWIGDTTQLVTGDGKLYLAATVDLFSRFVVGAVSAASDRHRARSGRSIRCFGSDCFPKDDGRLRSGPSTARQMAPQA